MKSEWWLMVVWVWVATKVASGLQSAVKRRVDSYDN